MGLSRLYRYCFGRMLASHSSMNEVSTRLASNKQHAALPVLRVCAVVGWQTTAWAPMSGRTVKAAIVSTEQNNADVTNELSKCGSS